MLTHPHPARRQHRPRRHAAAGASRAAIPTRCSRRWSPSSRAPTASRCTCARIVATSRTTTCTRMRDALQTRMNLEMAATEAMLAHCARGAAAGLLPRARATRGAHDRGRARRRRAGGPAARTAAPRLRERGHPRVAVHRPGAGADRGRARGRRAGRRAAHRRLCRGHRRAPGDGTRCGSSRRRAFGVAASA